MLMAVGAREIPVAVWAEAPQPKPLTAAQRVRLKECDRLAAKMEQLWNAGKRVQAVAAWQKKLAIEREVFSKDHPFVAQSLEQLADLHEFMEAFKTASKGRKEVLAIRIKLYGEQNWRVTDARLALEHTERLAKLSADSRKRIQEAAELNRKAVYLRHRGRSREALPLARMAFKIRQEILGKENRHCALSLNNLALLYQSLRQLAEAERLYKRARDLDKRLLGENHPDYATSLHNLAELYRDKGDYPKALPLYQQAHDLFKRLLGENHPDYATSLNNLALLYQDMGDYRKALAFSRQARDLRKRLLGENNLHYATSLDTLAGIYRDKGDYRKALPLHQQARDLRKGLLGENHPHYGNSLNNLAGLYQLMGDYPKALPLYRKARDLFKLLGENHPHYAASLNNLAGLYLDMKDYRRALALYRHARDLFKGLLGENHPHYANCLNNMAFLYQVTGDYRPALALYRQARDLYKRQLGESHPTYAISLNNLASVYRNMGDYRKALALYRQARDLYKRLLGENHPHYAGCLSNLAGIYIATSLPGKARPFLHKALAIQRAHLERTFTVLNDRQRLDFLVRLKGNLHGYLSVINDENAVPGQSYRHVLAWKGAVAARHTEELLELDRRDLRPFFERLQMARAGLARLARALPATPQQRADWLRRFDRLERQKEDLETRLARRSAAYRRSLRLRRATASQVAKALPQKTAFVDFIAYTHYSPPPKRKGPWGRKTKFLAFVLVRGHSPVCVRLGPSAPVEKAVNAWRRAAARGQDPGATGAELARLVWRPLRPHLPGARVVLIAPDGVLCGLPFAALPGQKPDSYLVEEVAIGYVTSGRHLLELAAAGKRRPGRGLLAVGGLAYGQAPAKPARPKSPRYRDLPGTRLEVKHVERTFRRAFPGGKPTLLAGKSGSAARLKEELTPAARKARWRYLHLATHGFFQPPQSGPALRPPSPDLLTFGAERDLRLFGRNPLLSSGLVLAGANCSPKRGMLTAEEVAGLDLRALDLAVLSACETGLGKVAASEGVLGLQRAFQAAGARTLVASLWKVNDAATSLLMERFYHHLWQEKRSKLEALRRAQLYVLRHPERVQKRRRELAAEGVRAPEGEASPLPGGGEVAPGRSHPALWAAFVLSGDPRGEHSNPAAEDWAGEPGTPAGPRPEPEPSSGVSAVWWVLGWAGAFILACGTAALVVMVRRHRAKGRRATCTQGVVSSGELAAVQVAESGPGTRNTKVPGQLSLATPPFSPPVPDGGGQSPGPGSDDPGPGAAQDVTPGGSPYPGPAAPK
jgi:CHAT domain-containing protein